MKIIADMHIHSKHSRATSKTLDFENLEKYAGIKGINLLGTGDFTHPSWIKEIKKLKEEDGILRTKQEYPFVLQTEISLIYSQDGKGRRVHHVVLAPSTEVVGQITEYLLKHGRVDYDGRPIFNIPSDEFVYELNKISDKIEVIPAHIWTPWFGMFGSKSGFDSMKDCFKDQKDKIHAIETGLSSDPAMNWRVKELDNIAIMSSSDLHSYWPWRLGREATIFELNKLTYDNLIKAIRNNEVDSTIEFWPEEGKYHYDGHRNCSIVMSPKESIKNKNLCPVCKKEMTIGVAHRVEELADSQRKGKPFVNLIPLSELISGINKWPVSSPKVWNIYNNLIKKFGNEINILLNVSKEEMLKVIDEKTADIIIKNREQKIPFYPGYDGEYGKPIFSEEDKIEIKPKVLQKGLGDF